MAFSARSLRWGIWIVCAFVFFLGTLLITLHSDIFISPDETANRFFTHAFSITGSFHVQDRLNGFVGGILHPRSVIADGSVLLPVGFLGLPVLYSIFVFFFGIWILPFLTPIIAILAALAWRKVLERWFSKRVAFVSGIVLLFHPAFWYYASRGLMPNVLFVSLLIFGTYFLFEKPLSEHLKRCIKRVGALQYFQTHTDLVLAGLCFGSALFVRLAEVYWVFPLVLFLFFVKRGRSLLDIFLFAISFAAPLILMLILNTQTYGHPFVTGYNFVSSNQSSVAVGIQGDSSTDQLSWLLPFGLNVRATAKHVAFYLFSLFWWLTGLTLIGLPSVLFSSPEKGKRARHIFTIISALLALWLGFWYGSWVLFDNPDPTQITIANSYVRYWLPLFILSTPFIASALVWLSERGRTKIAKMSLLMVLLMCVIGLNIRMVFFQGDDALVRVEETLQTSKKIRAQVFDLTPSDSILIVDRADKIFFPYRHVLYPLRSESTYQRMPFLVDKTSLYYYGVTLPQIDLDYLNQKKLAELGLHIDFIQTFGIESLYRIKRP